MSDSPISFEAWLTQFPNQELAAQVRRIISDNFLKNPEELIYNCLVAYQKAQYLFNLNPDNSITLETISNPVIGTLLDTETPNIKTQKTTYTVSLVSELQISESTVMGWEKPKP